MNIISDPLFYYVAIPVILLFGMGKGGLGPGVGAIAVPVLTFVINPVHAAAILLPILCVMDIFAVWKFRKTFSLYHLGLLLPAGVVGIVLASLLMGTLPPEKIRLLIGIVVIWFCLDYWFRGDIGKQWMGRKFSGYLWGAVAGFTSTQIHAGGAPVSIYLLPQKLDKMVLMGTMAIFFAVLNYIKLIPYTIMGALNLENITTSLVLIPLAPVGIKLGNLILHKVNQELVYRFLYFALFFSGIKLLYDGFF